MKVYRILPTRRKELVGETLSSTVQSKEPRYNSRRLWPLFFLAGFSGFIAGNTLIAGPTSAPSQPTQPILSKEASDVGAPPRPLFQSNFKQAFSLSSHKPTSQLLKTITVVGQDKFSDKRSPQAQALAKPAPGSAALPVPAHVLVAPPQRLQPVQISTPSIPVSSSKVKMPKEKFAASGLYNLSSVPEKALSFALEWISSDPKCKEDQTKLHVACCRAHCGGISDRAKGLLFLTLVASKTGRQLCFNQEYFLSGPHPGCEMGNYISISHKSVSVYNRPWIKRGSPDSIINVGPEEFTSLPNNPAAKALYISSSYAAKSRELELEKGRSDAKKFGMMALEVSGVLHGKMKEAQNMLRERLGSALKGSYVALNVRCGECVFKLSTGEIALGSSNQGFKDGLKSKVPHQMLSLMRAIPENIVCQRPLYISTDSELFRKEVEIAMPKGIKVVSCCSPPVHMGFGPENVQSVTKEQHLQHLVDLISMGESTSLFKGDGGFAELGAMSRSWKPVVTRSWNISASLEGQIRLMNVILQSLDCNEIIS